PAGPPATRNAAIIRGRERRFREPGVESGGKSAHIGSRRIARLRSGQASSKPRERRVQAACKLRGRSDFEAWRRGWVV
ncbi:hypothetical protein, partial [Burkholderia sp. SIMBA_052]|uniref:hypothetical protein n=1 Tax=Burkholderia sp. SIMBA_052 TaxID=3085793 RepID=UPI003978D4D3